NRRRRLVAIAGATAAHAFARNPAIGIPFLPPAAEPLPCRLDTAALVEVLKHPLCVGKSRRAVLDQLEIRFGRKLIDVWDFVEFAQSQSLKLDFARPPSGMVPAL